MPHVGGAVVSDQSSPTTFRCGHARVPENIQLCRGTPRCLVCHRAKARSYYELRRAVAAAEQARKTIQPVAGSGVLPISPSGAEVARLRGRFRKSAENAGLTAEIRAALAEGPKTAHDLAVELGRAVYVIRSTLGRVVSKGSGIVLVPDVRPKRYMLYRGEPRPAAKPERKPNAAPAPYRRGYNWSAGL